MPQIEVIKLEADVKDAIKGIEEVTDAIKDLEKAQKEQSEAYQKELEEIKSATKKNEKATSGLAKGFKGVGLAMKAAGIGLVLALVNKLSEALMKNQEVADTVESVFNAIGIIFKQVSDTIINIVKTTSEATGGFDAMKKVLMNLLNIALTPIKIQFLLIKGAIQGAQLIWEKSWFGSGDPEKIKELESAIAETGEAIKQSAVDVYESGKEIATNIGEAVGEVVTLATTGMDQVQKLASEIDIEESYNQGKRLTDLKKNFERVALEQQRLIEKYDEEAEKQRQIRDDVSISIEDRIAANKKLGEVLEDQIKAEQTAAQSRIDNIKQQIALEGESEELKNQLYEAETELLAISAKVTGLKSEQLTNENALIAEQNALMQTQIQSENQLAIEKKRFNAELIDDEILRLEKLKEIYNEEANLELTRLENIKNNALEGTQARIDAEVAYNAKLQELENQNITFEKQIGDTKKKISDEEAKTKEENLSKVGGALANMSAVLGQETAAGKATAIAATTISTYQSAQDSYKSLAGIPIIGPALGFAAAAAAVVGGVAQIKKIASTKIPKAPDPGGQTPPTTGPELAGGGAPSFNVVGSSDVNQLASVLGEQEQQPVQAFVVANDVTTAQSLERNIVETTSL